MKNSKKAKKLWFELSISPYSDIFAIKPNFLTWCLVARLDSLVMGSLLKFLSIKLILLANRHQVSQLFGWSISLAGFWVSINIILKKNARMTTAVELEQYMTSTWILCIIIYEFSYGQEPYSVILFSIKKYTKIYFYCTVLSLSLSVCL